jgi:hypothetical protein
VSYVEAQSLLPCDVTELSEHRRPGCGQAEEFERGANIMPCICVCRGGGRACYIAAFGSAQISCISSDESGVKAYRPIGLQFKGIQLIVPGSSPTTVAVSSPKAIPHIYRYLNC